MDEENALVVYQQGDSLGINIPECPDLRQELNRVGFFREMWYHLKDKLGGNSEENRANHLARRFEDNLAKYETKFKTAYDSIREAGSAYKKWVSYVEEKRNRLSGLKDEKKELLADIESCYGKIRDAEQDLEKIIKGEHSEIEKDDSVQLKQVYQHHLDSYRGDLEYSVGRIEEVNSQIDFYEFTLIGDNEVLSQITPAIKAAAKKFSYANMALIEAKKGGLAKASLLRTLRRVQNLGEDSKMIMEDMGRIEQGIINESEDLQRRNKKNKFDAEQISAMKEVDKLLKG